MTSTAVLVEDVHVRFGDVHALAGVDLDVPSGTTLGVLGHNGAGKTTLIRVLATLIKPGSGRVAVDGLDVVADATRLPFRASSFNAVICTETLEHLPDDRGAMREIARVLRDDGTMLGAVPSHFTEIPFFRLSAGYRNAPGGHVRIYAPHVLIARLSNCGLRVTSFQYVHFIDSLIWLRYCLSDAIRRERPRSDFEAAVMLAVAQQRPTPAWRTAIRRGIARSPFIALVDRAGAYLWPKSFTFVARKRSR